MFHLVCIPNDRELGSVRLVTTEVCQSRRCLPSRLAISADVVATFWTFLFGDLLKP